MPIVTQGQIRRQPSDLFEDIPNLGTWDYMTTRFKQQQEDNPLSLFYDTYKTSSMFVEGEKLSKQKADELSKSYGFNIPVPDDGIYKSSYDALVERKQTYEKLRYLEQKGTNAAWGSGALASLAGGFLDPINIGLAAIPIFGEAAIAARTTAAIGSGLVARATGRFVAGTYANAVGTAALEPITYGLHKSFGDDYSGYDSLQNIAFGGLVGGGLHVVGGLAKDMVGKYRGYTASSPEQTADVKWWNPNHVSPSPDYETAFGSAAIGNDSVGRFSDIISGRSEEGRWAAIESSHILDPRHKPSIDSKMEGGLDINRLLTSDTPTMTADGGVYDGYKRIKALRELEGPDGYAKYKEELVRMAKDYGLDPEDILKMDSPVLVRVLDRYGDEIDNPNIIRSGEAKTSEEPDFYHGDIQTIRSAEREYIDSLLSRMQASKWRDSGLYKIAQAISEGKDLSEISNIYKSLDLPDEVDRSLSGFVSNTLEMFQRTDLNARPSVRNIFEAIDDMVLRPGTNIVSDNLPEVLRNLESLPLRYSQRSAQFRVDSAAPHQRSAALQVGVAQFANGNKIDVDDMFNNPNDLSAMAQRQTKPEAHLAYDESILKTADDFLSAQSKGPDTLLGQAENLLEETQKIYDETVGQYPQTDEMKAIFAQLDDGIDRSNRIANALKAAANCLMGA
jgi:hypothetical protein